jgi:hypothetical protein
MCSSIIDKYFDWPKDLDSPSLSKFVSYYNMRNKKLIKCIKPQIICYVNYNKYKDPQNWSREQLLLFSPFRNSEAFQLGANITWQDAFNEKSYEISQVQSSFQFKMPKKTTTEEDDWTDLDEESLNRSNLRKDDVQDYTYGEFAPIPITNTLHIEKYDLKTDFIIHSKNKNHKPTRPTQDESFTTSAYPMMMEESEYRYLLRQLNDEERLIFDDFMHKKRLYPHEPIHLFLTGGTGTRKTFTLKLIIEGLLHLYNKELSADLEKIKALVMAYTGKVAFHVDGTTIHSALNVPVNQSLINLSNLSSDTLNKLTNKFE